MQNPAMLTLHMQFTSATRDLHWPPPVRTLGGALRTLLHEISGVGPSHKKGGTALNSLTLRGPYLLQAQHGSWQRLLPWPAHMLCCADGQALPLNGPDSYGEPFYLPAYHTGFLPYPALLALASKAQRPQNWLAHDALASANLALEMQVWAKFSKLHGGYTAQDLDYLQQLRELLAAPQTTHFGMHGPQLEVRLCAQPVSPVPNAVTDTVASKRFCLMLTTHADFAGDWKPDDFILVRRADGRNVWRGHLRGASNVLIDILAAYLPPMVDESGWDSSARHARPVRHLLAAGSVWDCELVAGEMHQLPDQQLGLARQLGRGEFVVLPHWLGS